MIFCAGGLGNTFLLKNLVKRVEKKSGNFLCDHPHVQLVNLDSKLARYFKKISTEPHTKDIFFYDRYSICIIQAEFLINISKMQMKTVAKNFFNDTYLVDQAACSSPIIINWIGKKINMAKKKFWDAVYAYLKEIKYNKIFKDHSAIDKEVVSSIFFCK